MYVRTCMRVLATSNGLLPSVLNVPADIPPTRFSIGVSARPESPAILCSSDQACTASTRMCKHNKQHASVQTILLSLCVLHSISKIGSQHALVLKQLSKEALHVQALHILQLFTFLYSLNHINLRP
jgi:hypothetical protein